MRGKSSSPRKIVADRRYNSTQITKFINYVMQRGKKSVAERIVYGAFDEIEAKQKDADGYQLWLKAIENITPVLEVRARRIGGANYQVPVEVRPTRRFNLACRWLIEAATRRKGKPMHTKLAQEIVAASAGEGDAVKKKEDVQRMAEANRAFAHFA